MSKKGLILQDNASLRARYEDLAAGDVVACRLGLRDGEEQLLCDLVCRGVLLIPSAVAQLCSRSKVLQAHIFSRWLPPPTRAVHDLQDLMETVNIYGAAAVGAVVCKLDRANAGMGVLRFDGIEQVYNLAVGGGLPFPFVLQPYLAEARDVRVIRLGEYTEAYRRNNPYNWRHNLHCGGRGSVHRLTVVQRQLCDEVMARGGFPYAHIDLLLTGDGACYLTEINLSGGIRGARISQEEYREGLRRIHSELVDKALQEG
ncbi:MAG: hypothetical protein BWK76_26160 [Desulfobulbaceae bacterium A2]|nr:MAG: hypothetical protein BWK76_26160 [Desulfobulbaceae bacterium A2]